MAFTKGNSVTWTNDLGKGITMNVVVSEYVDTTAGKFYVGVDTVQILSQTDWYIGVNYYLDGTITAGGHTILNASASAGTYGTGWMGSYNTYYKFSGISSSSHNTGQLNNCSNGNSFVVAVNLTIKRPSGYTNAAHGVSLQSSRTLTFSHSTNHTYTATGNLRSAATCTEAATYWYKCAGCGTQSTSYFSSGSALGHNYVGTVVAPTCTAQGYTTYKCSRCGDTSKEADNYTPTIGHTYTFVTNEDGSVTYTCVHCGDSYTVSATGSSKKYTFYVYRNNVAKKYVPYVYKDATWRLRKAHIF